MIDIIPYRTRKFNSDLSKQEIVNRLDRLMDKYHDIAGHTDHSKFIFERRINYQNPFKPTVRGEIVDNQTTRQIILNFRPKTGVLIFYIALIILFVYGGIEYWTFNIFDDYPGRQFILGALVFFTLLMTGFNIERHRLEKRLLKEFE